MRSDAHGVLQATCDDEVEVKEMVPTRRIAVKSVRTPDSSTEQRGYFDPVNEGRQVCRNLTCLRSWGDPSAPHTTLWDLIFYGIPIAPVLAIWYRRRVNHTAVFDLVDTANVAALSESRRHQDRSQSPCWIRTGSRRSQRSWPSGNPVR